MYKKLTKYKPTVDNGSITRVKPFIMLPFGVLAKPAKAFMKRAMGSDATKAKVSKAHLHLSIAAA
jgi:hypothetical protein